MTVQSVCQWLVLLMLVIGFFATVKQDFHGRKASEPDGFIGFIGTVVVVAAMAAVYYGAGALPF